MMKVLNTNVYFENIYISIFCNFRLVSLKYSFPSKKELKKKNTLAESLKNIDERLSSFDPFDMFARSHAKQFQVFFF